MRQKNFFHRRIQMCNASLVCCIQCSNDFLKMSELPYFTKAGSVILSYLINNVWNRGYRDIHITNKCHINF